MFPTSPREDAIVRLATWLVLALSIVSMIVMWMISFMDGKI